MHTCRLFVAFRSTLLTALIAIACGTASAQEVTPSDDWLRVSRLEPAADVHVLAEGRGTLERRLVRVEADQLLLLNTGILTKDARDETLKLLRRNPNLFDDLANGRRYVSNRIRIGSDGIRDGAGRLVAAIDAVLDRLPRDSVLEVSVPAENPRRMWGIVGLTLIATATAVNAVHSQRACDCPEMGFTPVGTGLFAGGLIAMASSSKYAKVKRGDRTVIFRRR
jgi:hypothetical protein